MHNNEPFIKFHGTVCKEIKAYCGFQKFHFTLCMLKKAKKLPESSGSQLCFSYSIPSKP